MRQAVAAAGMVFLAGLTVPVAGGGEPGGGHPLAVSRTSAAANGTIRLASHDSSAKAEPGHVAWAAIAGSDAAAGEAGIGYSPAASSARGPAVPKAPWQAAEAPLPAGGLNGGYLSGVACPSVIMCVAVGDYTDSSGSDQGLLLTRHGPSWTAAKAPVPAGAAASPQTDLSGMVACPSVTVCVAAGGYADSSGNSQAMLLTRHGPSWTAAKVPVPGGAASSPSVDLSGLACPSATVCVATGSYTDSSGKSQGLLLTKHGWSWTAARPPLPAGGRPGAGLGAVVCPSVIVCVATGSYTDSSGNGQVMLLTRHGQSWTAAEAPLPAGLRTSPELSLGSLACPSTRVCVVTGTAFYADSVGADQGLLLTGHGPSWTAAKAPLAALAGENLSFSAVACPSVTACVITANYSGLTPHAATQGMLLTRHGSSWTAARPSLPADARAGYARLRSVACPSAASCVITGSYTDSTSNRHGLLLTGHGSSWTAVKAPLPANAAIPGPGIPPPGPDLGGVACPASAVCVAVGDYTDSAGNMQGLLLTGAPEHSGPSHDEPHRYPASHA
jgi:hypothetical protein